VIERYCTPGMTAIWSRQAKTQRWLDVEIAICEGWHRAGVIPAEDLKAIQERSKFDLEGAFEVRSRSM